MIRILIFSNIDSNPCRNNILKKLIVVELLRVKNEKNRILRKCM